MFFDSLHQFHVDGLQAIEQVLQSLLEGIDHLFFVDVALNLLHYKVETFELAELGAELVKILLGLLPVAHVGLLDADFFMVDLFSQEEEL